MFAGSWRGGNIAFMKDGISYIIATVPIIGPGESNADKHINTIQVFEIGDGLESTLVYECNTQSKYQPMTADDIYNELVLAGYFESGTQLEMYDMGQDCIYVER